MTRRTFYLTLSLSAAFTGQAFAQGWEDPGFFSPRPMDNVGIYAFRTDAPGDPTGLKVIWRQSGNINLGVHAGTGDFDDLGNAILLGAELYGPLTNMTASTGLMMSWGIGAGAVFGDSYINLSIPLGVSIGLNVGSGGTSLLPYVHPRVSLDVSSVDDAAGNESTDTNIALEIDVGADLSLGERFIVRAGASIGDREGALGNGSLGVTAFGAGIALRIPRKVIVR